MSPDPLATLLKPGKISAMTVKISVLSFLLGTFARMTSFLEHTYWERSLAMGIFSVIRLFFAVTSVGIAVTRRKSEF